MNWGYRILFLYGIFAVGMVLMAIRASREDVGLVSKDYYAQELDYSRRMGEMSNEASLKDNGLKIQVAEKEHKIDLQFPLGLGKVSGEATLFRPSDEHLDQVVTLLPGEDGHQVIPTEALAKGLWHVKVRWGVADKIYYKEEAFVN